MDRDEQADILAKSMVKDAQLPPYEAMAIALALTFAADNQEFVDRFGTFTQEHLRSVVDRMVANVSPTTPKKEQ